MIASKQELNAKTKASLIKRNFGNYKRIVFQGEGGGVSSAAQPNYLEKNRRNWHSTKPSREHKLSITFKPFREE
jgi:hypothetical protein